MTQQPNSNLKTFKLASLPGFAGLYSITNEKNECVYIGESGNIIQRLRAHRSMLERKTHFCKTMQDDANTYGLEAFQVTILSEAPEDDSAETRKIKEKEFIEKIPLKKRYNKLDRSKENNGFFGRKHTPEFRERLSMERSGIPKGALGRAISIPPFRTRKGTQSEGGTFLSVSEASAQTGMSRRDIRSRLNSHEYPEWRELTKEERNNFL